MKEHGFHSPVRVRRWMARVLLFLPLPPFSFLSLICVCVCVCVISPRHIHLKHRASCDLERKGDTNTYTGSVCVSPETYAPLRASFNAPAPLPDDMVLSHKLIALLLARSMGREYKDPPFLGTVGGGIGYRRVLMMMILFV